jgi:hypothetical protein
MWKGMKQYRYFTVVLLSVLLTSGAACSRKEKQNAPVQTTTSEGASVGAQKLDSCTLVSKADVQQVVGKNVDDPKPNQGNAAICDFKVGDYGAVSFMVQQPGPSETPDKMIAELKKRNIQVTETQGIGDRSFFASPGYGMIQLITYKGPHYIILTLLIPGAGEDKQRAAAGELMRKALSKL